MAIILGGDDIDAELTIGPDINADGLVFHIDVASTDSIVTKGGVPLADGVEVDYMYGLIGDGQRVAFAGTAGFPYYVADKGGYLYVGADATENIVGTLSDEVVLGSTYTLDIWVSPRKSVNDRGIDWLTGQDLAPTANAGGRSILLTVTNAALATDNYGSVPLTTPVGAWVNVTIVTTPQAATYYANGVFRGIGDKTYTKAALDIRLQYIGSPNYSLGGGDTSLGPIKAYNRALTAQEVLYSYNTMKSRYMVQLPIYIRIPFGQMKKG